MNERKKCSNEDKKKSQKCEIIEFPDDLRHQKMPINANRIRVFYRHLNKKDIQKKPKQLNAGSTQRSIKLFCANILYFMVLFLTRNCIYSQMGKFLTSIPSLPQRQLF